MNSLEDKVSRMEKAIADMADLKKEVADLKTEVADLKKEVVELKGGLLKIVVYFKKCLDYGVVNVGHSFRLVVRESTGTSRCTMLDAEKLVNGEWTRVNVVVFDHL